MFLIILLCLPLFTVCSNSVFFFLLASKEPLKTVNGAQSSSFVIFLCSLELDFNGILATQKVTAGSKNVNVKKGILISLLAPSEPPECRFTRQSTFSGSRHLFCARASSLSVVLCFSVCPVLHQGPRHTVHAASWLYDLSVLLCSLHEQPRVTAKPLMFHYAPLSRTSNRKGISKDVAAEAATTGETTESRSCVLLAAERQKGARLGRRND